MDDVVEIPVQRCLYRQSSLETRLTPEVPPIESDDESSNEEIRRACAPRIVDVVLKKQSDEEIDKKENVEDPDKTDIKRKLEDLLRSPPGDMTSARLMPEIRKAQFEASGTEKKQSTERASSNLQAQARFLHNEWKSLSAQSHQQPKIDTRALQSRASLISFTPIEAKPSTPLSTLFHNTAKESNRKSVTASEDDVMRVIPNVKDLKRNDSKTKMATLRPKSPRPAVIKPDKEESIWDKLGTLGRKKRIKEVQEVQAEGKYAIDSPGNPVFPAIPPEEYELDENEERSMVEPGALDDPKVQELIQILIEWINDELAPQRIIVQDLAEDLYDGQVLQKLLEKLTNYKMDVPEVTQSEEGQKQKLAVVLAHSNNVLGVHRSSPKKWGVESIHSKNIVAILYLLVALARHFRAPIRLPEHVSIKTVVVQKTSGQLSHRFVHENITSAYDDVGMRCERDAFDTLFDHAPDKLQVVKKSMVTFVNKHLNKINLEVTELESQFHDGVYLTLLMGLLEGFFVPLYCFHLTPKDFDQKVHNVAFAFELMEEVGISKLKARPEDIVNMDLKSTLRVLYQLFSRYKDIL